MSNITSIIPDSTHKNNEMTLSAKESLRFPLNLKATMFKVGRIYVVSGTTVTYNKNSKI